jgi:hypothetical protein|tara:strand:+ start:124 stop:321 length:198 start_codon:yes stop_codon:yes gene_type:complete
LIEPPKELEVARPGLPVELVNLPVVVVRPPRLANGFNRYGSVSKDKDNFPLLRNLPVNCLLLNPN